MKIHDCVQGTAEWHKARIGIPTASKFGEILTPGGKLSASSRAYAYRLVAERLLNAPAESTANTEWMERGREFEPKAVRQYEFAEDVETYPVGFITTDDGRVGASPDRLVRGRAWGVEIKCPAPHTMIGYLLEGRAEKYRPQVQGQLMVAELAGSDFYAFHPRMPPCLIRATRDEPYIRALAQAISDFCEQVDEMTDKARALGLFQPMESVMTPHEMHAAAVEERLPEWAQGL